MVFVRFLVFVDLIQKALSKTKKNQKAIFEKNTYKSTPRAITRVYQEQVSAHLPCSESTRVRKTVFWYIVKIYASVPSPTCQISKFKHLQHIVFIHRIYTQHTTTFCDS